MVVLPKGARLGKLAELVKLCSGVMIIGDFPAALELAGPGGRGGQIAAVGSDCDEVSRERIGNASGVPPIMP